MFKIGIYKHPLGIRSELQRIGEYPELVAERPNAVQLVEQYIGSFDQKGGGAGIPRIT